MVSPPQSHSQDSLSVTPLQVPHTQVGKLIAENEFAVKFSGDIWKNRQKFPPPFTRWIECGLSEVDSTLYVPDYESSDNEASTGNQITSDQTQGREHAVWLLDLQNAQRVGSQLEWVIGRHSSTSQEKRTLSALTAWRPNDFSSDGVASAVISIHPRSGILILRCTKKNGPIHILEQNNWTALGFDETRAMYQNVTLIRFGKSIFRFVRSIHDKDQKAAMIRAWDSPRPGGRLEIFPGIGPFAMIGSIIIQSTISVKGSVWNYSGVEIKTGEPVIVQEHSATEDNPRSKIIQEAYLSLAFFRKTGILQAREVWCEHGGMVNGALLFGNPRGAMQFCSHKYEKIHFILPCPVRNSAKHDWNKESFKSVIQYILGPMEGLANLHDLGWIHGNIDSNAIKIMSEQPPVAVLCNLGGAIRTSMLGTQKFRSDYSAHIPPSEPLSEDLDALRLAMVFCSMLFPDAYEDYQRVMNIEDPRFRHAMMSCLSQFADKNNLQCKSFVRIMEGLLADDPNRRLSPKLGFDNLAELINWQEGCITVPDWHAVRPEVAALDALQDIDPVNGSASLSTANTSMMVHDLSLSVPVQSQETWASDPYESSEAESEVLTSGTRPALSGQESPPALTIEYNNVFEQSLEILRDLGPNSNMNDLVSSLPRGCNLMVLLCHCKGEDTAIVRRLLEQGKDQLCISVPFLASYRDLLHIVTTFGAVTREHIVCPDYTNNKEYHHDDKEQEEEETEAISADNALIPRKRSLAKMRKKRYRPNLDYFVERLPDDPKSTMFTLNNIATITYNHDEQWGLVSKRMKISHEISLPSHDCGHPQGLIVDEGLFIGTIDAKDTGKIGHDVSGISEAESEHASDSIQGDDSEQGHEAEEAGDSNESIKPKQPEETTEDDPQPVPYQHTSLKRYATHIEDSSSEESEEE